MKLMLKKIIYLGFFLLSTKAVFAADLVIQDAWIPEAPPVSKVMAGYMMVHNKTAKPITLISASAKGFDYVEMHKTVTEDGLSKMIKQEKLVVPANGKLKFERGGLHLMFFGPTRRVVQGESVPITLKTSDNNTIQFTAQVKEASIKDKHDHHHHHH